MDKRQETQGLVDVEYTKELNQERRRCGNPLSCQEAKHETCEGKHPELVNEGENDGEDADKGD